ncbi:MAG: hypothetical protein RIM99_17280 [Cyclobacteriaceae bacterium]
MKKIQQNLLLVLALFSLTFLFSCGDDNEAIAPIVTDEFDARINNFATDSLTAEVFVSDVDDNVIDVLLSFTSTDDMKRVYITRNIQGQGDEKLDASDAFGVNDKADGSIDLDASLKNGLAFSLDFPVSGLPDGDGTVVYKFWTTTGKGDFRDATKRNAEGPATLTINLGGTNPAASAISQEDVQLFAPLADGTSASFLSTADGETYTFNDGELASLWDFGYFYSVLGATVDEKQASFASVSAYENAFDNGAVVDMQALAMDENGDIDLNNFYFSASTADDATFTAVATSGDLDFIQTSTSEEVNNLAIGDIIAFVDQYGKKGLIRITDLQPANGQFYNQGAFIQFDVKIQP